MKNTILFQKTFFSFFITFSFLMVAKGQFGANDATFNPLDVGALPGANHHVRANAIQADGKIIIVGYFTQYYDSPRNRIARLNADYTHDTTFNIGTGANQDIESVAVLPDGKILIAGAFTSYNGTQINRIARLNSDGTLDTSFNPGTGANSTIYSMVVNNDGKITIVGFFTHYNSVGRNRVARLLPDGPLDTNFNPGIGANQWVNSVSIQDDNKIIISGNFDHYNGTLVNRIARINEDGTLDTSFNTGTGANAFISDLKIQSDGRVLICGNFNQFNGVQRSGFARLEANGAVDLAFNAGNNMFGIREIAIQPDNKIIIGGWFSFILGEEKNSLARLNYDGSLDNSFDVGEGAYDSSMGSSATIHSITVFPDGKILVTGDFGEFDLKKIDRIALLHSNGNLNTDFNSIMGANDMVMSSVIQADGKIILGGYFTSYNQTPANYLVRINPDGSVDPTFNIGTGPNSRVNAVAIDADGKILVGGEFSMFNGVNRSGIVKLNSDGSLDPVFNSGSGAIGSVSCLAIQSDNKVLIGGWLWGYNGTWINRIVRINENGSVDLTFNPGSGPNSTLNTMTIQSDGKILIGGWFSAYNGTGRNRIARIHPTGAVDTDFNPGSGFNSEVTNIFALPDNKIIVTGGFTNYSGTPRNRIARINPTGSIDLDFNPGAGANSTIAASEIQSDGKILIGGWFTSYGGTPRNYVARVNPNGSLDTTFDPGNQTNGLVYTFSLQPDGKIIIGGDFTIYNSAGRNRVARISNCIPDNTVDVINACESYTWIDGVTYTASNNTATHIMENAAGCDSTITLNLTIGFPTATTDVIQACGPYTWIDGITYTSNNNTATHVLTSSTDCDSTVTLDISFGLPSSGVDVVNACGAYTWIDGNTYTTNNNTATHIIQNSAGCDSTVTLNLTITIPSTGTDVVNACGAYTWIDGNTYTTNNNTATHIVQNAAGCDSTVTLNLTITIPQEGTDIISACDSYTWIDGNTYTSSNNTATHIIQNAAGCDSTVTLNLTINPSTFGTDVISACGSHIWIDGITYTENNNAATHVLQSAAGCDSTVTLNLTISIPDADVSGPGEVCLNSPATISLSNSDANGMYVLRNDANNAVVAGPIAGTGAGLTFNTGNLTQTTTYNVLATIPVQSEALDFDGINDGVHVGQIQGITNSVSVEAWIFPKGNVGVSAWDRIFDGNWVNNFTFCSQAGMPNSLNLAMGGISSVALAQNVLVPNEWQHVAFTYDDVTKVVRLYRNGTEVATGTYAGGARTTVGINTIGSNAVGTEAMNAIIDEVRLWNTTRTPAQLNENMNTCLTGNEPGLVLYFDFDDEMGSPTVTDKTGNGHNGTLVNMNPANDWVTGATVCVSCENEMTQTVTVAVSETPAPSGDLNQSFCNTATLADLQAGGENIQWYDAASGGNLLSAATALTNGTSYFASQTVDGCESVNRLAVQADVSSPSAPTATSPQTSCNGTVAELGASGSNIQWYDAATGGNLLAESTPLVNNTIYYASQTIDACESAGRTPVTVQVLTLIDQTVNEPSNPFLCENGSSQIAINSSEKGINYSLRNEDNVVVSGPSSGTGNALSFNTGNIAETSDFHVLAEVQPNTSMQFDGVNDFVNVGTSSAFNFSGAFTIETWVNIGAFDKAWQAIVTKGDNTWRLHRFSGTDQVAFGTSGLSNTDLASNTSLSSGTWHHIAAVYTGTQKLIYINGVLDASSPVTGTLGNNSLAVLIGENAQAVNRHFNGKMDEVRIWNVARTQAQIQANLNNQLEGNETGLLAYYRFNELAGAATALDYSTNNFNATLTNMNNNTVRQSDVPFQAPTCSFQLSETKTITVDPLSVAPSAVNSLYNMCHGGSTTLEIEGGSLASGADWEWFSGTCNTSVIGTGSSIEVTPTANTSYFARASAGSACPPSVCAEIQVNLPATSTNLSLDGDVAACFVNQNEWVHFYNSNGRLIASINSGGQDLGNVSINSIVSSSAAEIGACDEPNNPIFMQAVLGRSFVVTPEHQPAAGTSVQVRFYITESEFESYQLTAENNQNTTDDVNAISDLHLTKVSNGLSTGIPDDLCDATDATVEYFTQSNSGDINALNGFTGFDETAYLEFTIDGFSEFFIMNSQNSSALPVQLTAFSATCNDDKAQINWTTASELNASHYILQSSRDGQTWLHLAQITAAGTTNQTSNYSYSDQNFGGLMYYRLVQVDNDGQQEIFGPISSNCSIDHNLMTVHPNPSSDNFTVIIQTSENMENATVDLVDMSGRVIMSQTTAINAGSTMLNFDVKAIQPGAYMIRVKGENDKFTPIRVVKM